MLLRVNPILPIPIPHLQQEQVVGAVVAGVEGLQRVRSNSR
jgi:hypothetical protein